MKGLVLGLVPSDLTVLLQNVFYPKWKGALKANIIIYTVNCYRWLRAASLSAKRYSNEKNTQGTWKSAPSWINSRCVLFRQSLSGRSRRLVVVYITTNFCTTNWNSNIIMKIDVYKKVCSINSQRSHKFSVARYRPSCIKLHTQKFRISYFKMVLNEWKIVLTMKYSVDPYQN